MGHVGNTLPHMSTLGGTLGGTLGSHNTHGTLPNMANMTNLGGQDGDAEFEPSCLVRTPSGNVYIPTGESPAPGQQSKGSPADVKITYLAPRKSVRCDFPQ